jgi:hypothetical protein
MDGGELLNRFAFHPATTQGRQEDHQKVRDVCLRAAERVVELCPPGREQSLAVTKLEEAMMWANAGIARSGHASDD